MFVTADNTVAISALIDQLNLTAATDHAYVATGAAPSVWGHPKLNDVHVRSTTGMTTISAQSFANDLDPWVEEINQQIEAQRTYVDGWDGERGLAPDPEALDYAAQIADYFAILPMAKRPQYDLDCDGRPTFALYDDEVYLHLTVDANGVATWYSVVNDVETFSDVLIADADIRTFARDLIQPRS